MRDPAALVLGVTVVLFVSACAAPAVYFDEGGHACTAIRLGSPNGFLCLLMGWIPPWTFPWVANPLLLVGAICVLCRQPRIATWLASIAVAAGLSTWVLVAIGMIPRVLVGCYLWQASHVVFAVGCFVIYSANKPAPQPLEPPFAPVCESPFASIPATPTEAIAENSSASIA